MIILSPEFPTLKLTTSSASRVDVSVIWNFEGDTSANKTKGLSITSATTTTIFEIDLTSQRRAEVIEVIVYSYGTNSLTLSVSDNTTDFNVKRVDLTANQSFFLLSEKVLEGGSSTSTAWADITGKPSTFTPTPHNHVISDVSGLQTALDSKSFFGSFTQSTPALLWTVNHGLNREVSVTVQTLGGIQIFSSVNHTSLNQFTVSFNTPQAGKALYIG